MALIKRFGFFALVNVLVMVTVGIVWSLVSMFFLGGETGPVVTLMAFCAVMGMAGSFVSLAISRWMAKKMHGVQIIDPSTSDQNLSWIVGAVHRFARGANLPAMPEVGVYESDDVNAFATGPSKKRSLVAVSTGLLRKMTREEAEGVLAHEVSHIANGDMVTMTLIQGIVNTFALFFSRILAGIVSSNVDEKMRGIVHFALTIIGDIAFTMLGSIVVAWFSRRREFRADAGAASLASRSSMIAALRRLQSVYEVPNEEEEGSNALATLKISHRQRGGLVALFSTHPPLEQRIRALEGR